jgi:hypothetical protein
MPATGNFLLDKGYDAAAALTIYRAVKFSAEETVTPVTAKPMLSQASHSSA